VKKRDYFLKALASESYRWKSWVFQAFSLTRPNDQEKVPYRLEKGTDHYFFFDPELEEDVVLTDTEVNEPPFRFKEKVKLKKDEVANLDEDIESTYGNLLANYVVLIYSFGDKIPYIRGEFNIKGIEKEIERRLTTNPEFQGKKETIPDNPIYVSEYLNYIDAILSLEGFSQLCVPSATRKTMTRDPRIPEIRAALLEKYKDSLDDPATIAKIDEELVKVDKEWMKGDLGEGFYHKAKSFEVVRKKAHLMHGAESGFQDGQKVDLVKNSLSEGWDIEKLPSMVNSLREGTYSRGAMTALGGESTKTINRIFQNTAIKESDCGSKLGWEREITKNNAKQYIGFFRIVPSGTEEITEANHEKFIGKTITLRTPMFCKTPKTGFCETCMGKKLSENPNALGALAAEVGSTLMLLMMGAMHGKSLKTEEYKPAVVIS
jgi:hypothetical protein